MAGESPGNPSYSVIKSDPEAFGPLLTTAAPAQSTEQPTHIVRFCDWTSPTYGEQGEMGWNVAFKAAQLAIAIANSAAQQEIADKQMDLADKWFSHQKYKWTRFNNTYLPIEKQLINNTAYERIPELDCDSAINRAEEAVKDNKQVLDNWMGNKFKSYRICSHNSSFTRVEINNSTTLVDCINYNLADERWYRDYKEDKRWNNRSNVLNLGRNLDSQALQYGDTANKLFSQVGHQLDRFGSAAMTALGYFGTRNEGFIPMTYLGTGGQSNTIMSAIHNPTGPMGTAGMNSAHSVSPGGIG